MTREEALKRVIGVMREVFDRDELEFSQSLALDSVGPWDSLSHIRLLHALEQEFGFRFTSEELDDLDSAGDILNTVVRRSVP